VEEPENYVSDEEIQGDDIEKSSTSSPLEVILVPTEFTDVFSKDSTMFLPEVTPVTMEFNDVLSKNLSDKLPLTHDIQHAVDLTSGASLPDLVHHTIDPTMHIELKRQVDGLSQEIKQHGIVPSDIHFYEDKFWNYIVTNDVGQIKDFIIYGRSISKDLKGTVMEETNVLHIINFLAITVKLICAFLHNLPVRISLDVVKIIGKLSHIVRMICLIIPFDRDRVY